jgi:hypothetical protein
MSEFTLRSHGADVGQQFSWERTCERVWERQMGRALLWVVKWSIWTDCHMFQGFRMGTRQKGASIFIIHNEMYIFI